MRPLVRRRVRGPGPWQRLAGAPPPEYMRSGGYGAGAAGALGKALLAPGRCPLSGSALPLCRSALPGGQSSGRVFERNTPGEVFAQHLCLGSLHRPVAL